MRLPTGPRPGIEPSRHTENTRQTEPVSVLTLFVCLWLCGKPLFGFRGRDPVDSREAPAKLPTSGACREKSADSRSNGSRDCL